MKLVYFGCNNFVSCLETILANNHDVVACFVSEELAFSELIIHLANQNNIPVYSHVPTMQEMKKLVAQSVECFFSAEYPYKIPVPYGLDYAVNLHTSLLPYGRGAITIPYLISTYPEYAGLTLHKLTGDFDHGDILIQHPITVETSDSFSTLWTKMFLQAPAFVKEFLHNIDDYYGNATEQLEGSTWSSDMSAMQKVDWSKSIASLHKQIRAFGHHGVIATIDRQRLRIKQIEFVLQEHNYPTGSMIFRDSQLMLIAVADGIACIPCYAVIEI